MELLGKAQLLLNLLALCLQLSSEPADLGQGASATPWGSMGPGSGPAAGRCVGKRETVTTDKVIKRQNATPTASCHAAFSRAKMPGGWW